MLWACFTMGTGLRVLVFVVLVVATASAQAQEVAEAWTKRESEAPTQLIVKYRNDLVSTQSAELSISRIRTHPSFKSQRKMFNQNAYVVEANDAAGARTLHRYIQQNEAAQIEYVEYDLPLYAYGMPTECGTTTSDCTDSLSKYWGIKKIKADKVWSRSTFGGTNILGAVVDTGIEWDHPELAGVVDITDSTSCTTGMDSCSTTSPTTNGKDDQDHGTHCAGIIGALHNSGSGTPIGVATSIKLISCKFMDSKGSGSTSGAVDCINLMVSKGAKVISNSWGGDGTSSTLGNAMKAACQANVLLLAAAGNDGVNVNKGTNGAGSYPANYAGSAGYECVVAVAATDASDRLTYFSNFGANVMIAAPGSAIYSTVRAKDGSYAYYSGTSMATPFVAGAALALWNSFPTLTMQQVRDLLITSATVMPAPFNRTSGPIGGRLLDVDAAVTRAQQIVAPNPVNCVGDYAPWSPCSVTCGGGTQSRTYIITTPAANGGTPCPFTNGTVESQPCNTDACVKQDCVGSFGDWTTCSEPCGGGTQTHTYNITTPALSGGAPCPYTQGYTETQACNTDACPSGAIDCVGSYTSWGPCSKTCGGGTQNRTFVVTVPASNSGKDCSAINGAMDFQVCNTQSCAQDPGQTCSRNSQCSVQRVKQQLPIGSSTDCYSASCTNGYCKTASKAAGSRCSGGFCDGSGFCKACLVGVRETCPRSSPVCLTDPTDGSNKCGCSGDSSCPANTPYCKDGKQCVQCLDNSGCASQSVRKICDPQLNLCVHCLSASDCSSTARSPFCDTNSRTCVQCLTNTDCNSSTKGPVCNSLLKTCGCSRNSDCLNLPNPVPTGFDAQCLTPACALPWVGTCTAAANAYKSCIVAGTASSTANGYCSVTTSRGVATGASCVACKASGVSCSASGECCSGLSCIRNRNGSRQCA